LPHRTFCALPALLSDLAELANALADEHYGQWREAADALSEASTKVRRALAIRVTFREPGY
jgi:hypothetical protein